MAPYIAILRVPKRRHAYPDFVTRLFILSSLLLVALHVVKSRPHKVLHPAVDIEMDDRYWAEIIIITTHAANTGGEEIFKAGIEDVSSAGIPVAGTLHASMPRCRERVYMSLHRHRRCHDTAPASARAPRARIVFRSPLLAAAIIHACYQPSRQISRGANTSPHAPVVGRPRPSRR